MRLLWNWKQVLKKAWSIRFALISAVLSAMEFVIPYVSPAEPNGLFALAAGAVSLASALARIIAQPSLWRSDDVGTTPPTQP